MEDYCEGMEPESFDMSAGADTEPQDISADTFESVDIADDIGSDETDSAVELDAGETEFEELDAAEAFEDNSGEVVEDMPDADGSVEEFDADMDIADAAEIEEDADAVMDAEDMDETAEEFDADMDTVDAADIEGDSDAVMDAEDMDETAEEFDADMDTADADDIEGASDAAEFEEIVAAEAFEESGEADLEAFDGVTDGDTAQAQSLSERLADETLFTEHEPGGYEYDESECGKSAAGSLKLAENARRDPAAQRMAGGEDRREYDDGGHLIGTRFEGAPGSENIDAQDRNLNRGAYKKMENDWAKSLENDDKVFAEVQTYKPEGSDRPEAYMGSTITEHSDGTRDWDVFSFTNESSDTLRQWEKEIEETAPLSDGADNVMMDENYQELQKLAHEEDDTGG